MQLEVNALQRAIQQTMTNIQKIENEIQENLQQQVSLEKGALGAKKDNRKISNLVHERESLIAQLRNELSQIKLESLNVSGRVKKQQAVLEKLDQDLKVSNETIEKFEIEIRRRNDELSKKQSEMDALNKKYDQLMGKNQAIHFCGNLLGCLDGSIGSNDLQPESSY